MRSEKYFEIKEKVEKEVDPMLEAIRNDEEKMKKYAYIGEKLSHLFDTEIGQMVVNIIEGEKKIAIEQMLAPTMEGNLMYVYKGVVFGCDNILNQIEMYIKAYDKEKKDDEE